jgi:hypothetical protein
MNSSISGNSILSTPVTSTNPNTLGKFLLKGINQIVQLPFDLLKFLRTCTDPDPTTFEPLQFSDRSVIIPVGMRMPSQSQIASLFLRELPGIFDISPQNNDFYIHLRQFVLSFCLIKRDRDDPTKHNEFNRYIESYNNTLSYLQRHLARDECDDDIASKRHIIHSMQPYISPFVFRDPSTCVANACSDDSTHDAFVTGACSGDSTHDAFVAKACSGDSTHDNSGEEDNFSTFPNYDGFQITSDLSTMKVSSTCDIVNGTPQLPVVFGFESSQEAYMMLRAAIDEATLTNLELNYLAHDALIRSDGGSWVVNVAIPAGVRLAVPLGVNKYHICLKLRHTTVFALIDSTDTQLQRQLLGDKTLDSDTITLYLNNDESLRHPGIVRALGHYLPFHVLMQKRIVELIDASFKVKDNRYITFDCYRPECKHLNLYRKDLCNKNVRCSSCNIAEMCVKCGNTSHGGDCEGLEDDATKEWLQKNTAPCPKCNVDIEKNGGCNHMTCRECKIHFCWLCMEQYAPNQISAHYQDFNSGRPCAGRTQPRGLVQVEHQGLVQAEQHRGFERVDQHPDIVRLAQMIGERDEQIEVLRAELAGRIEQRNRQLEQERRLQFAQLAQQLHDNPVRLDQEDQFLQIVERLNEQLGRFQPGGLVQLIPHVQPDQPDQPVQPAQPAQPVQPALEDNP